MFLCEQQEGEWLKEADTYTASTRNWLRDVTYHNLDTYQNWQCLTENRISRHVWLKTYLKCRVVPKIAELKHTLMHKCTTISVSRLSHRFWMSARSGSTGYHNALPNKINPDRTSYYLDGLMFSVFAESLSLSQVKDSSTQIHTIRYYIAEIYPVLLHWWGVYAILLLCWGIRYIITLLSYTQH